jgi:hypothetical protein
MDIKDITVIKTISDTLDRTIKVVMDIRES